MADSVVKLKVNSQEYDQKIQRAAQGLRAFIEDCRKSGQSLTEVSGETMQFVQNLGKMPTVAENGVKSIREYTKSITDLTIQFRSLSDEEKKSPFGQALAAGIQQLTERAGMVKDAMNDVSASINNASSDTQVFDQLAQGMNVAMAGFQGLTGAGRLLGIEMGDDVAIIAKLQAAMAVTNSLTTIQTALQKQSALMQGIVNAQKTAGAAAEALLAKNTALATAAGKAFNAVASASPLGLLATLIGAATAAFSIFSGGTNEAEESVKSLDLELNVLARDLESIQRIASETAQYLQAVGASRQELLQSEVDFAYNKKKRTRETYDIAFEEYNKNPSDETFERMQKAEDAYLKASSEADAAWKKTQTAVAASKYLRENYKTLNTTKQINAAINEFTKLQEDTEIGSAKWQEYESKKIELKARLPKTTVAGGGGGGGRGGGRNTPKPEVVPELPAFVPIGSEQYYENAIQALQKQAKVLPTTSQEYAELKKQIEGVTLAYRIMKGEFDSEVEAKKNDLENPTFEGIEDVVKQQREKMNEAFDTNVGSVAKEQEEAAKRTAQAWQLATQSINQVGSALQGLEDPSAKIAGLIGQAIANIALGFAQAAAKDSKLGVWGWIAAVAGGLATMVSTISAIHSATGYAQGGIVKGNSYSGDNIGGLVDGSQLVGLNAGELVLTRAMQGNLAQQLEGNGIGNLTLTSKIRGENIIMSINSTSRRRGKGEMVTSKFKR